MKSTTEYHYSPRENWTEGIHCPICRKETIAGQRGKVRYGAREVFPYDPDYDSDPSFEHPEYMEIEILVCNGCNSYLIAESFWDERRELEFKSRRVVYPKVSPLFCTEHEYLPERVEPLLLEFFNCHAHKLYLAAAMCLRATIETSAAEILKQPIDTWKQACKDLVSIHKLKQAEVDRLSSAYDLASAVIHRGHSPKPEEIDKCWNLAKAFFDDHFWSPKRKTLRDQHLDQESLALKAGTPPRPKKASKQNNPPTP